jgi:hypothetical protein
MALNRVFYKSSFHVSLLCNRVFLLFITKVVNFTICLQTKVKALFGEMNVKANE